ncbi:MAG: TfoX/Sxy family protein, partial [Acidimicrobiia bacterium]|nr:TfoX/Sxy family protein [Acidimicrobiia bacterium]
MAYDRELAERIRSALAHLPVVEKSMFGGLSFMVNNKIAVTANTHGDLMVRCDPAEVEKLVNEEGAEWPRSSSTRRRPGEHQPAECEHTPVV